MDAAPSITALRPEPQTLLMVVALTESGNPALRAAWRAGAWPAPAWMTWPMKTSSTFDGSTPARSTAARMATAPRSVAAPWRVRRRTCRWASGGRQDEHIGHTDMVPAALIAAARRPAARGRPSTSRR